MLVMIARTECANPSQEVAMIKARFNGSGFKVLWFPARGGSGVWNHLRISESGTELNLKPHFSDLEVGFFK
jgi:hypothetical protein